MKVDLRAIQYILRTARKQHRVELVGRIEGTEVQRHADKPGWFYLIRSRPIVHQVEISERDVLLATSPEATLSLIEDTLAIGASALRGAMFRDLLMNDRDYPVDYIGDGTPDEIAQRIEALGVALVERSGRLG